MIKNIYRLLCFFLVAGGVFFPGGVLFAEQNPHPSVAYIRFQDAYKSELKKAESWMTTEKGRRNYIRTKEVNRAVDKIIEKVEKVNQLAMKALEKTVKVGNDELPSDNTDNSEYKKQVQIAANLYEEAAGVLAQANEAFFGKQYLELSDKNYDTVLIDNKIMYIGGRFDGENEERVGKTFFMKLLPMINRTIGVLGILYLLILGVKFILAQGDEEKMGKYKDQAIWLIVGLGIVSVAEFVGFDIFDPNQRDVLSDSAAKPFYDKLMQLVRFFEYIAMGLVLVNGIISGYKLITSGEEEETVSQEKNFLKSFILGTIFILMAEVIVRVLAYQDENLQTTQDILIQEVAGIINFILTFIGGVAMLMLIVSSIYYVTSFGEEDQMNRAKRMILSSIGGIVIAFSAYTIAQFLVNH